MSSLSSKSRDLVRRLVKRSERSNHIGSSQPASIHPTAYEKAGESAPVEQISADESSTLNAESLSSSKSTEDHGADPQSLWMQAFHKLPEADQQVILAKNTIDHENLLEATLREAKMKREACQRRQLAANFLGKRIILRDMFDKLVNWIDMFKQIGDVVVNFDPVHAAIPWAVIRFVLQTVTLESEQTAALVVGLERTTRYTARCRIYEELYFREPPRRFVVEACKLYDSSSMSRTLSAICHPERVHKLFQECDDLARRVDADSHSCEVLYNREAGLQVSKNMLQLRTLLSSLEAPIMRIGFDVDQLREIAETQRRSEILQWISRIPYESDHKNARENRAEGSGRWLMEHPKYIRWRTSSGPTVLWLCGPPGTGKTTLVSTVVDDLKSALGNVHNDETLAYFYCDKSRSDRQAPEDLLNSLLRQISAWKRSSALPRVVCDLYDEEIRNGMPSGALRSEQSSQILLQLTSIFSQSTLVVDALDECHPQLRRKIFRLIRALESESTGLVKILVSSRPDGDIKHFLTDAERIEIESQSNRQDIRLFVEEKIARDQPWHWKFDAIVKQDISRTIIEKSDGMFQWAKVQLDEIFELSKESEIRDQLQQLPEGLYATYDGIFSRIQSQKGSLPLIAHRAFQWMLMSRTLLSPKTLAAAVCQDPASLYPEDVDISIDMVLEACRHLIVIDRHSNSCRFSHISVAEYLEQRHYPSSKSNILITKVCLVLLSAREATRYYQEILDNPENMSEMASLFEYVMNFWTSHVTTCEKEGFDENVSSLLQNILGSELETTTAYQNWYDFVLKWYRKPVKTQKKKHTFNLQLRQVLEHLQPSNSPALPICLFGFSDVASYWWDSSGANVDQYAGNGFSLVSLSAIHGSVKVLQKLLDRGSAHFESTWGLYHALLRAIRKDNIDAALWLLDHGASPNRPPSPSLASPLQNAIAMNNEAIVRGLLRRGADPNQARDYRGTLLQDACTSKQETIVSLLIQHGAHVNTLGGHHGSALQAACAEERLAVVKILLENGADPNNFDADRKISTPLQSACREKVSLDLLALLIEFGADVNIRGGLFGTAVHAACAFGSLTKVKYLMQHGANLLANHGYCGSTMQAACYSGNVDVVRFLVERGADVNQEEDSHLSPIRLAMGYGYLEIVRFLFDMGAGAKDEADMYISSLCAAIDMKHTQIAMLLLDRGADPNQIWEGHDLPLHKAVALGDIHIVKMLLEKGADPNALCRPGTAAAVAVKENKPEVLLVLLEAGADMNLEKDTHGESAVSVALKTGNWRIAQLMMTKGVEIDLGQAMQLAVRGGFISAVEYYSALGVDMSAVDSFGRSILHVHGMQSSMLEALQKHRSFADIVIDKADNMGCSILHHLARDSPTSVIEWALSKGLDPNQSDNSSWTPLHWAAYFNSVEGVRTLLKAGADPGRRNKQSLTAGDLAQSIENVELKDILPSGLDGNHTTQDDSQIHVICDICDHDISGLINHCVTCTQEFDLCFRCFEDVELIHSGHHFATDWSYEKRTAGGTGLISYGQNGRQLNSMHERLIDNRLGNNDFQIQI